MIEKRYCEKHGYTDHTKTKDGRWRCKKCFVEYSSTRKKMTKEALVAYKGGKCEICGYDKCIDALEFHHLDQNKKVFNLSEANYAKNLNVLKQEADKCILVCANCHREIHSKINAENRKNRSFDCLSWEPKNRKKLRDGLSLDLIQRLHDSGKTQKEIAQELGVSVSTLKRFLVENKISFQVIKRPTKDELNGAFANLKTIGEVAKHYLTSYNTVKQWCVYYNIVIKGKDINQADVPEAGIGGLS